MNNKILFNNTCPRLLCSLLGTGNKDIIIIGLISILATAVLV